ncbi:circadian-associated transcriptional repressor-like isoform X1 [Thunnus maccoyii]|uniref:circadian-associated transcriptional repressor-like isoform X1 n=1 Tax=Thunnus maccoyii TaxID=8240 RepID=UPI001C4BB52E|nr:circadian-associated transcriptional repressor-like isoform X1 [Thunnus maccoyii]XP_042266314.1 circadian-associated transcriptional repressor-like isoform X1 [Thunnus maccoyii]
MSTSDSDYSIDWLASDEDDYDGPERLTPQHADAPPVPSSSSSSTTTSLRESPSSCFRSGATQRRRSDCKDGGRCGDVADSPAPLETPAVSPVQGFTSVCKQQTLSVESKHHAVRKRAHSAALDELCEKPQPDTENELFSHKCMELQCYVQPLSSILRGLRSGRYSERLSSFQESVAMDRIQRIMGVLQNPNMGGRFLSIILKIEEMLQSWFPHIKPNLTQRDDSTPAKKQKQHHSSASPPPSSPVSLCSSDSAASSTHLKWFHTSPICSLKTPESALGRSAAAAAPAPTTTASSSSPLPSRCSREVTQDNAVSSSTDSHTRRLSANPRLSRGPLPFKISSPCLERLLQAKESIIAPRTVGDGGWLS